MSAARLVARLQPRYGDFSGLVTAAGTYLRWGERRVRGYLEVPGETAVSPPVSDEATSAPALSPPSPDPPEAKRPSAPTITLCPDLALALLR